MAPRRQTEIPSDTVELAKAVYPRGNEYIRLRDELGEVFTDEQFSDLYVAQGQAALAPAVLAWVTVLQFKEGWSDREAADAVRGRIDVKYLLGLELKHQGFHHSALGAFRQRLVENGAELRLLEQLLAVCRVRGFVKAGGRQRTDSTPVVAAVQSLNRLECVHEALRLALEQVAELEPEWLQAQVPVAWYEWYGRRLAASQMAKSTAEKERWQVRIGESGWQLLLAVQDARTPAYLRQLPALQLLQRVWLQQYWVEKDRIQWRTDAQGLPPSDRFIQSPHDPEARFRSKRQTQWTGYMVHLTETCDDELPHLVVNVETTPAASGDADMTAVIHTHLAAKDLLPAEHYVDSGYQSAANLVSSSQQGIDLIGPAPVDTSWQARTQTGFDVASFDIDWDQKFVICPEGKRSSTWREGSNKTRSFIKVGFARHDCGACPRRAACVQRTDKPTSKPTSKPTDKPRRLQLQPQPQHRALAAARQRQETPEFRQDYRRRAGIEGTISQAVRTCDARHCRYIGQTKTHLQQIAAAVALNLARLADWLLPLCRPKTKRLSHFARLAPACL
jgi:transposase